MPLADERFDLVLPAAHLGSREVQGLMKVLASPWLLAQLASLPGYDAATCGERGLLEYIDREPAPVHVLEGRPGDRP